MASILIGLSIFEERRLHIWDRIVDKRIFMILLVSITLAYSNVPTVAYIGEKAPNVTNIKMMKIEEREKDYFLGISQGTLVIQTNSNGEPQKYYSSIENNPYNTFNRKYR